MKIEDGTGNGKWAKVDSNNQLHTFSVSETEQNSALEAGALYNINSGIVALTGTGDSAVLYIKNNEAPLNGEAAFIISSIIVGVYDRSGTISDDATATIIRNPTAGTIVSDANAAPMISNSNFGSSNLLTSSDIFAASATGKTLTDGTDHAIVLLGEGRTAIPELNIDLPNGSSIGVNIDLNTSGGANVYVAVVGYRKDGNNNGA